MDLFTINQKGRFCIHKATNEMCVVKKAEWFRGHLTYDLLVPQKDEKGKLILCNATYSENEIELLNIWI